MKSKQHILKILIVPLVVIGCCVVSVGAETIHVPKDVPTIQEGIDRSQGDDTVLVSPGRYNESINFNGKAITLKSEKGAAETIIDGLQIGDSVVKCINGEGPSTKIDGFTITGGTGNKDLYGERETVGGGLLCLHSSPTVLNCIFVDNESNYQGGAIYNGDRSNTIIRNCKIRSNKADRGAGIYNTKGAPEIRDTEFSNNYASYGGGGMYNYGSSPRVISCTFRKNKSQYNGGAIYDYDSSGRVTDTTFINNVAMFSGNAVYRGYRSVTYVEGIGDREFFKTAHDTVEGSGGYMVARGRAVGACCVGTGCLIVDEQSCVQAGGSWLGPNSSCDQQLVACPKPNTGDINTDGVVDMMDLVLLMTSMEKGSTN
ncbi:MAG: hypothetical protein H8E91_00395 [Planctomycetes bacterium]|nr:hypothetical protein [Planctomycetota bacterium]